MSYTCRVYSNSGFNAVNIPDSPTLLNSVPYVDYPALDILQNRELSKVDIKVASYDAIKNADYVNIGDWFYFVESIIMMASDVARLALVPDFITSAGGIGVIEILDGITNRVHVGSDEYGEWCEADPYMAPAEPLEEAYEIISGASSIHSEVVVKSTLNLAAMGDPSNPKNAYTYSDNQTPPNIVTVPQVVQNSGNDDTIYKVELEDAPNPSTQTLDAESKTKLFDANYSTVRAGLAEVNSLGVNGAVTEQVMLPSNFVTVTKSAGVISEAVGRNDIDNLSTLPYEYSNAKNKKIDYSEYTPYGIITASGDTRQFMPADLRLGLTLTHPGIRTISDPRTDGKPYFRFVHYKGDDSIEGFFKNCVTGIPWKQVPLVYEGAQGKALTQLSNAQSMNKSALGYRQTLEDYEWQEQLQRRANKGKGITGAISVAEGIATLDSAPLVQGLGTWAEGFAGDLKLDLGYNDNKMSLQHAKETYAFEKAMEISGFMANTGIYTPVVQFPFSADLYNDMYKNPCYCYRLKYSANDIARIDKILTMYGYKVTKPLEKSDFTNRQKFNYVESSISVGGTIPRWLCNGIALQLMNGVRVWHVLPSNTHYTNNPIATP